MQDALDRIGFHFVSGVGQGGGSGFPTGYQYHLGGDLPFLV